MKYEWLLFDADGTLFDYNKAELLALKGTFKDFDVKFSDSYLQTYRQINNGLFKDFEKGLVSSLELRTKRFELLFSEYNIELGILDFSNKYLKKLSENSMLLDDALQTISKLYPDFKMLLVTNGLSDVQRPRFDNSKIKDCFEDIIISDEVGVAKPSTAFFDIAFKTMDKPDKNDVMIIGDSLSSDMAGGINYGIDTCWYNSQNDKNEHNINVTYEIHDLHEILKIVDDP